MWDRGQIAHEDPTIKKNQLKGRGRDHGIIIEGNRKRPWHNLCVDTQ